MTNLYDGQLTDLLQNDARSNPEVQALAYAMQVEKRRIMDMALQTRTISMIEQLPESILDVLAVELRTPYYTADMTIEQKRGIIKNTLVWFYRAGTPAAVRELVSVLFGQGEIVEWFDFTDGDKTPGTFDIVTDTHMTEDIVARFLQIIERVKNTRSHLRRVLTERQNTMETYIGSSAIAAPETNVLNSINLGVTPQSHITSAVVGKTAPQETIMNHAPSKESAPKAPVRIGAALVAEDTHVVILSDPPPSASRIGLTGGI